MRSRVGIVPKLFSHWWETLDRPHRIFDQRFGQAIHPEQLIRDFDRSFRELERNFFGQPTTYRLPSAYINRNLLRDEDGYSMVKANKDKFQVSLDVQQFKPDEINVKVVDNCIVVEGKHEEKQDDHGFISRHFVRKYMVPEQCDPEKASSTLSEDGLLTISAPRKPEAVEQKKEIDIKIEHIGKKVDEKQIEQNNQNPDSNQQISQKQ